MSKLERLKLKTTQQQKGQRLDQVLAEWLPGALSQPVSKGKVRKLIIAGAVYLNGKRVRIASKELQANAAIDVYVDRRKLQGDVPEMKFDFKFQSSDILYEDQWLIAVNKPAGLPTQPTLDEARANLFALMKKFLIERDSNPQVYLGLHHRLDRDTSGVILLTKSKDANAGIARAFQEHLAQKTYHALTVRPRELPKAVWKTENYLGKTDSAGKKAKFGAVRSGGDLAITDFKILEVGNSGLWVEARPKTGRTHQIRVHLSESGMPILGDPFYGDVSGLAKRVMLHAVNLTFPHPISHVEVSVQSPLPEDFNTCLQQLRVPKTAQSPIALPKARF